jgi:hypothetical protein
VLRCRRRSWVGRLRRAGSRGGTLQRTFVPMMSFAVVGGGSREDPLCGTGEVVWGLWSWEVCRVRDALRAVFL